VKEVFGPPYGSSILEKSESPEDFFLVATKLLWGQAQIQRTRVKESSTRTSFAREVCKGITQQRPEHAQL